MSDDQVINVSVGGAEYVWPFPITEIKGKVISGDAVSVSLGHYQAPGAWVAGTVTWPTSSTALVSLWIDGTVAPGSYYLWVKVVDTPEVVIRRGPHVVVV